MALKRPQRSQQRAEKHHHVRVACLHAMRRSLALPGGCVLEERLFILLPRTGAVTLFFKVVSSSQNAQAFRLEAEYFATQHARREREREQAGSIRKGLAAHLAASDLLWSAALRADEDSGRSGENASRARKSASCRLRAGVGDPGLVESLCRGGEEQQQQPARQVLQQQQQQGQQARAQHCYKKDPIRIRRKKVRRRRSLRRHRCAGRLSSLSSR